MALISGVIFDMDGLLLDSEPFWKAADLEVYGALGIELSSHLKHETTGLRVDAAVAHWYAKFPWAQKSLKDVEGEIIAHVEGQMLEKAAAKAGAIELVKGLFAAGIPLAVCSSSPLRLIETALRTIGILEYFKVLHSAESEVHGKPHPAAYLTTADKLELDPTSLLVFEDSLLGAIAGKAARMKVVAVPEEHYRGSSKFDFCDLKLESLKQFDLPLFLRDRTLPETL